MTQTKTSLVEVPQKLAQLFDLRERRVQVELMDDPALDPVRHFQALRGLSRLNQVGRSAQLIWPKLAALGKGLNRTIRVLDVATGAGDVPQALARLARKHDVPIELAGCDISPRAIEFARRETAGAGISFFVRDAQSQELPAGYDAIICSLFLHHLSTDDARAVLGRMASACGELVVVSDLNRTRQAMALTYLAAQLVTRSDVVHVDGPLSVQAAFRTDEVKQLAEEAGLRDCSVRPAWPCRFLLTWWRGSARAR